MFDHAPSPQRLRDLAAALERIDLSPLGGAAEARRTRAVEASASYLAPRLDDPAAPLVVVVAGPGGGGKSTILNSLARRRIGRTGPVRPTTTAPVAWTGDDLPPTLDRLRARVSGEVVDTLRPPPEGVVLVDSPPPEVLDRSGRAIAESLIRVADALVFVAGATRYADAETFTLLESAARRGLPTVIVLNRLPQDPGDQRVVVADFAAKLARRRLIPRPDPEAIVAVAEGMVSPETGGLGPEDVARVRKEVEALADPQARPGVAADAVEGALRLLRADLAAIRADVIDGEVRRVELLDPMLAAYRQEGQRLVAAVKSGRFATAEPDRISHALASAAARRAGSAARLTAEAWAEVAPDVLDGAPELYGHGRETLSAARERIDFWLDELGPLIDSRATRRLSRRRRRRLIDLVRRAALDRRARPTSSERRLLDRVPGVVEAARELLAEELRGIVEADARRFRDRLGPGAPPGILAELAVEPAHE